MPFHVLSADKVIRLNNFSLLGLIQGENWAPTFNAQDVFEMGNSDRVDTSTEIETSGALELTSQGNTAGLLARMVPKRTAVTGAFTGYLYSGSGASTIKNGYTINDDSVGELQFDMVIQEKPDQVSFSRSVYLPRCFVASISGRADSNGMASETFNWAGQEAYGFDTPYHDIVASPCTVTSGTVLAVQDTVIAAATHTLIFVWIDDKRFRNVTKSDASKFTFAGSAGATTLTLTTTEGYSIPSNAICRAVFYKTTSPSTAFPTIVDAQRGTSAFYVKGYQADIFLGVATLGSEVSTEQLLKVQSVDYSIELNQGELRQIAKNTAGTGVYCRVPTPPYKVSVNMSLYESDWSDWKKLLATGGTNPKFPGSGNDVYTDSYDFTPANMKGDKTNPLKASIKYYTKSGTLIQTLQFDDLRVEQYGQKTQVGGRAEVNLSLGGTRFTFVGVDA